MPEFYINSIGKLSKQFRSCTIDIFIANNAIVVSVINRSRL